MGTKNLGFQERAKFSPLKSLKEVIQLRFWENPNRSFLLALAPRGSLNPRRVDVGQPQARPIRVHPLPGGWDRNSGAWAEGKKSRVRADRGESYGPQLPTCPAGCAENGWLGALTLLPLSANRTQEGDMTRIFGDQWWGREGGCFLTTHLALRKILFQRLGRGGLWRARRAGPEGAAAPRKRRQEGPGPREARAGRRWGRGRRRGLASLWSGS